MDRQFLGSAHVDAWVHRRYIKDGDVVDLLMVADRRLDPLRTLISPKLLVPGSGWKLVRRESIVRNRWERAAFVGVSGSQLVELHYSESQDPGFELLRSFFALDRGPWGRTQPLVATRITTPIRPGPDSGRAALNRIVDFQRAVRPRTRRRSRPRRRANRILRRPRSERCPTGNHLFRQAQIE